MPDPARPTPGEALRAQDEVRELSDMLGQTFLLAAHALTQFDQIPCGEHDHQGGAMVYYCPWCERDVFVDIEDEHPQDVQHAPDCLRQRAVDAIEALLARIPKIGESAALPPEGRHPEEPVLNWEQGYQQICEVAAKNLERAERAEAAFSVLEPIDVGYAAALIEDRIASEGPVNQPLLTERARRLRQLQYALNLTGAEGRAPTEPQSLIPLNEAQARAAKDWAADDRLWTTQETVAFNLRTFARVILKANLLAAPTETPPSDGAKLEVRTLKPSAPPETPARLQEYLTSRKALLNAMIPMDEKAAHTKWHRLNELEQLEAALVSPVDPQEP